MALAGWATGVAVELGAGGMPLYAHVAARDAGLHIVAVGQPSSASLVATVPLQGEAGRVALDLGGAAEQSLAYVAAADGGLRVVDISDRTAPSEVSAFETLSDTLGVALGPDLVYVVEDGPVAGALRALEVSHPTMLREAPLGMTGTADEVTVLGRYAYVAAGDQGVRALDVANPMAPVLLSQVRVPGSAASVAAMGRYLYVANGDGLAVVDVLDPADLQMAASLDIAGRSRDVVVAGAYAYVACLPEGLQQGGGGLHVVNISDPLNPAEVGYLDTGWAERVVVNNRRAYVAAADLGLLIVDVTDPEEPKELGANDQIWARDVAVLPNVPGMGTLAYVAKGDGIAMVNVSDAANPLVLGTYAAARDAFALDVAAPFLYVANGVDGLLVLDLAKPLRPREVVVYDTPGRAAGLHVVGVNAYVADSQGGVVLVSAAPYARSLPLVFR